LPASKPSNWQRNQKRGNCDGFSIPQGTRRTNKIQKFAWSVYPRSAPVGRGAARRNLRCGKSRLGTSTPSPSAANAKHWGNKLVSARFCVVDGFNRKVLKQLIEQELRTFLLPGRSIHSLCCFARPLFAGCGRAQPIRRARPGPPDFASRTPSITIITPSYLFMGSFTPKRTHCSRLYFSQTATGEGLRQSKECWRHLHVFQSSTLSRLAPKGGQRGKRGHDTAKIKSRHASVGDCRGHTEKVSVIGILAQRGAFTKMD